MAAPPPAALPPAGGPRAEAAAGGGDCSVCLGELEDACSAPCGHAFCRRCILGVLRSSPPEWSGLCPLCREYTSVFNLRSSDGQRLVAPRAEAPWGSVFVQGGGIGVASYHFDAEDDCYISYARAPGWKLDDGSSPPARKPWTAVQYDPQKFVFRGVVEWSPAFGGTVRWDYRLHFAEDFSAIIGGSVTCAPAEGGDPHVDRFCPPWEVSWQPSGHLYYLRWNAPPADPFGSVFVQGLHYAPGLEGIASYHFDSPEDCYISYSSAPDEWRLDDGSHPPRRKPFADCAYDADRRTFTAVVHWDPPFHGDVRWEYEMVFAEDFGGIASGQMRGYSGPTTRSRTHEFGQRRAFGGPYLCYVRKPGALALSARQGAALLAGGAGAPREPAAAPREPRAGEG
ncbi:unnamed protein product, partial [Prorocentrum cordatum]